MQCSLLVYLVVISLSLLLLPPLYHSQISCSCSIYLASRTAHEAQTASSSGEQALLPASEDDAGNSTDPQGENWGLFFFFSWGVGIFFKL